MTGIYKKFKSGTDIRGIGIGNGDEPLYMSDGFISKASAAFADFLSEKTGKAADKLTVAIGHDPRLSAGRISAAVVRGLAPPPGRQKRTQIFHCRRRTRFARYRLHT